MLNTYTTKNSTVSTSSFGRISSSKQRQQCPAKPQEEQEELIKITGDCHIHLALNGVDYQSAQKLHAAGVHEPTVRVLLEGYANANISLLRDGGDAWGVARVAKRLAPEFGIDYLTPVFAIHKSGHYGNIVGRTFTTLREYAELVDAAAAAGADFIKLMTTGIMSFKDFGSIIAGDALPVSELRQMVHIAHEQGFAVMSHTNGKQAVLDAISCGVDSIEHANFIDSECLDALAQSQTIYVPTANVTRGLLGTGLGVDSVLEQIWQASQANIAAAIAKGVTIALGSDAGATGVRHVSGTYAEYACFADSCPNKAVLAECLQRGEAAIRATFVRH